MSASLRVVHCSWAAATGWAQPTSPCETDAWPRVRSATVWPAEGHEDLQALLGQRPVLHRLRAGGDPDLRERRRDRHVGQRVEQRLQRRQRDLVQRRRERLRGQLRGVERPAADRR